MVQFGAAYSPAEHTVRARSNLLRSSCRPMDTATQGALRLQWCAADQWFPNVSVEGSSLGATVSQTQNSRVAASASSDVSIWETIGATSIQNHRESRERRNCMTALGWKPMNNTWDGTPAALNESIAVNRSVMTAVKDGYSHPLLGAGVVALIDMGESGFCGFRYCHSHNRNSPLCNI